MGAIKQYPFKHKIDSKQSNKPQVELDTDHDELHQDLDLVLHELEGENIKLATQLVCILKAFCEIFVRDFVVYSPI